MKKFCVLIASALSVTNVKSLDAINKYSSQNQLTENIPIIGSPKIEISNSLNFDEHMKQSEDFLINLPLSTIIMITNNGNQNELEMVPNVNVEYASQYPQDDSDSEYDHEINYFKPGQPEQYIIPNNELLEGLKVILKAPSPYCPSDIPSPFVGRWKFSLHDIISKQTPFLIFLNNQISSLPKPMPAPYVGYILSNVDFYVLTLGDEIVGSIGVKRIDCPGGPPATNVFVLLDPKKIE